MQLVAEIALAATTREDVIAAGRGVCNGSGEQRGQRTHHGVAREMAREVTSPSRRPPLSAARAFRRVLIRELQGKTSAKRGAAKKKK